MKKYNHFDFEALENVFDATLDLGATDEIVADPLKPAEFRKVSVGESCKLIRGHGRSDRMCVKLVKTLKPSEVKKRFKSRLEKCS